MELDLKGYKDTFKVNHGKRNKTVDCKWAFKRFGYNFMFHEGETKGEVTISEFGTGKNVCSNESFLSEPKAIKGAKNVLRSYGVFKAREVLEAEKVINTGEFTADEPKAPKEKKEKVAKNNVSTKKVPKGDTEVVDKRTKKDSAGQSTGKKAPAKKKAVKKAPAKK